MSVATYKLTAARLEVRECPEAVVLNLIDPVRVVERFTGADEGHGGDCG
jgi:hypothetical protein